MNRRDSHKGSYRMDALAMLAVLILNGCGLRRALPLVAFSLLTSAATATAECAWVLWQHSLQKGQKMGSWQWQVVEESRAKCLSQMRSLSDFGPSGPKPWETMRGGLAWDQEIAGREFTLSLVCLPDTFDPRRK